MAGMSSEQLAQRAQDAGLLDPQQLQSLWNYLGSRSATTDAFQQALLRRELLTNYQIERLIAGYRTGFFYGDYKVLYLVGTGTFARVYRAAHRKTDQLAAVKVLRRRFSEDKEQCDCFYREGKLGSSLQHPNIVPIYEVSSKGTTHYFAMEFIEGRSLREFIKVRKKVEPAETTRLMIDIASGLNYAFQRGISHRDLKMSNVLVSSRGQAKLVDFGLASAEGSLSDEAISKLSNPRTIDYAGLERSSGVRRDDARSDIFFAGCIYYHMLTGKAPLMETRDRMQRLSKSRFQNIPPILEVDPSIPLCVTRVVNKAIDFDPERRYQTPTEMVADLSTAMARLRKEESSKASGGKGDGQPVGEGIDESGRPRTVMIVEGDVKMQNLLRNSLKRKGYRVLVMSSPERAANRFSDDPSVAEAVLFSTAVLSESALEAFNQFGTDSRTCDIPAVLLLNELHARWKSKAETSEHRVVVLMPLKLRKLRQLLADLIAMKS